MASENAINPPRIDRQFVDAQGRLTPYGYSVLTQLIERVGGSVGQVINGREIANALGELEGQPRPLQLESAVADLRSRLDVQPRPHVDTSFEAPDDAQLTALRAEVDKLRTRVDALEIGYPT